MQKSSEALAGSSAVGGRVAASESQAARQAENFARAQELGQIGWWRLDTALDVLTWSEENYRIFGAPCGAPQSYQTFLEHVHPDDRGAVDESWAAALAGAPYDIEHRIIANGAVKWVREKAVLEFDGKGVLLGAFGITQDITEQKRSSTRCNGACAGTNF
ncbi:PAS domain-containing protein [Methylocystis echinoides]|nr:PAS domain-containing protein [Methylocystis echinoides]